MRIAHLVRVVREVFTAVKVEQRPEGAEGENHLKPVSLVKVLEFFEELTEVKDLSPNQKMANIGLN